MNTYVYIDTNIGLKLLCEFLCRGNYCHCF